MGKGLDPIAEFFTVWNPAGGPSTVKHSSFDVARGEAERLAERNPGQKFYVMAPLGHSIVEKPSKFVATPLEYEMPF